MKQIILFILFTTIFSIEGTYGVVKGSLPVDSIKITVNYLQGNPEDVLSIQIFENHWKITSKVRYNSTVNESGKFIFEVPVSSSVGYLEISLRDTTFTPGGTSIYRALSIPFFWEKGDDILCSIDNIPRGFGANSKYTFEGRGSKKYEARAKIFDESLVEKHSEELADNGPNVFNKVFEYDSTLSSYVVQQIDILQNYSECMTKISYDALKSDLLFPYGSDFNNVAKRFYDDTVVKLPSNEKEIAIGNYYRTTGNLSDTLFFTEGFRKSLAGAEYLFYKFEANLYVTGVQGDPIELYNYIVDNTDNELRELMLTYFFRRTKLPETMQSVFTESEKYFNSPEGWSEYQSIRSMLKGEGFATKEYELFDIDNKKYHLTPSFFKDKIVILDFYFVGCAPCRFFYKNTMSKIKKDFKNNPNIMFVAISCDRKYDYWLKGVQREEYTTISPNTVNLFAGERAFLHPIFRENNINRFPMVLLLKDGETLYFDSVALHSYESFKSILNNLL